MSHSLAAKMREKHYLLPGEILVVDSPCEITTILGSCVSIILYEAKSNFSGMIHYLLPRSLEANTIEIGKYADLALPKLIELMRAHRPQASLQAKMFGGGKVLEGVQIGNGVGEENISMGLRLLADYGLAITEKDLGGVGGRKLCYSSDTHEVVCENMKGAR